MQQITQNSALDYKLKLCYERCEFLDRHFEGIDLYRCKINCRERNKAPEKSQSSEYSSPEDISHYDILGL